MCAHTYMKKTVLTFKTTNNVSSIAINVVEKTYKNGKVCSPFLQYSMHRLLDI